MKLRVLSLITLLAVLLGCMTACLNSYDNPNQNINLPDSNTTSTETESESDSDTAKTPVDINVYTLNGTTGFGFAKMMNDAKNGAFETENYTFTVQSDASVITSALINGDVDIAALPTNAAANLYNVTEGGVKILAVNTLGCLYLLTKEGTTVETL
ncbi:MAG: ABC transporter substrate-binding protein, partial [Clostridia bacterium]|nr:ABC transporter substrate-binding protein [Clostridia bacterium]